LEPNALTSVNGPAGVEQPGRKGRKLHHQLVAGAANAVAGSASSSVSRQVVKQRLGRLLCDAA